VVLIFTCLLAAQTPGASPPLVRGVLLERDAQTDTGEFSVRAVDNHVFRYQFDRQTYVERENQLIDVSRLRPGEKVEVLSDAVHGLFLRYARTVHVVEDPPPPRTPVQSRLPASRDSAERSILLGSSLEGDQAAGNLTYSGVVSRLSGERLVLHTRDGDRTIQLRPDTQYLENGEVVGAAALKPNTRVSVRAAKDLYDQVVGYQVIWGQIFDPEGR
jgi:hypothetical protein